MLTLDDLAKRLNDQIKICLKMNTNDSGHRSVFQKEYHKVIFSDYFRSLANKTQVSPIPENDHTHTRMPHSLEVACLGYSFGELLLATKEFKEFEKKKKEIECQEYKSNLEHLPDIIATACLVHDIGNPPFGHAGEEAVREFFEDKFGKIEDSKDDYEYYDLHLSKAELSDFIKFDGNANGFRIITRLAGKYPDDFAERLGFGFSPLTLAAFLKYPFPANYPQAPENKFGYFQSEKPLFDKILKELQDPSLSQNKRHPLVYFVEAADDICNWIIDFEDAIKNGHCRITDLWGDGCAQFPIDQLIRNSETLTEKDRNKLDTAKNILTHFDSNQPISRTELKSLEVIRADIISLLFESCFKNYTGSGFDYIKKGEKYALILLRRFNI